MVKDIRLEADKELYAGIFAVGSLKLKSDTFWGRQRVETYKCGKCKKMIIDLKENTATQKNNHFKRLIGTVIKIIKHRQNK